MSIAVIIPTYNSGPLLRETLDSVVNQTLPPDEIIIVDDGSTDGTLDLIAEYGPRMRLLHRDRQRQSRNRNLAAAETACEWIAFLDHDDLWEPNKLERQLEELARNPRADLCYTARINLVQSGDGYRLANVIPVPPADRIRQGLFRNTVFMPGSVLMRRSTFLAAGGFDPHFKFVEDWDLWFRLFHAGVSFAACLEPLLQQRMHASNQSNDGLAVLAECDEIYRRHALPHLRFPERLLRYNRVRSEHEMAAAFRLRSNRDPRCLSMTMRSILRDPFHDPLRYKVLLHILYTRLTANSNISPG